MKAAELLSKVEALPARERRQFLAAVRRLDKPRLVRSGRRNKRISWPDVEARAKQIFGNRVLPSLILLEREEELN